MAVFGCGESVYDICFWLGQFPDHFFTLFVEQNSPKLDKATTNSWKKSIHGSAEKQFAVQKKAKSNL